MLSRRSEAEVHVANLRPTRSPPASSRILAPCIARLWIILLILRFARACPSLYQLDTKLAAQRASLRFGPTTGTGFFVTRTDHSSRSSMQHVCAFHSISSHHLTTTPSFSRLFFSGLFLRTEAAGPFTFRTARRICRPGIAQTTNIRKSLRWAPKLIVKLSIVACFPHDAVIHTHKDCWRTHRDRKLTPFVCKLCSTAIHQLRLHATSPCRLRLREERENTLVREEDVA